jgi:hypothetical protein
MTKSPIQAPPENIFPEYDVRGDDGSANREPRTANLWLVAAEGMLATPRPLPELQMVDEDC